LESNQSLNEPAAYAIIRLKALQLDASADHSVDLSRAAHVQQQQQRFLSYEQQTMQFHTIDYLMNLGPISKFSQTGVITITERCILSLMADCMYIECA
jgi:hypothetical protein